MKLRWHILLIMCTVAALLCSCTQMPAPQPTNPEPTPEAVFDYAAARERYGQRPLAVDTSFRCSFGITEVKTGYTVKSRDGGGYTATEHGTDQTFSSADTEDFFTRVCYLAPYDTALTASEDGYTALLDGQQVRAYLLASSTAFAGYADQEGVTISDCTYTVQERDGEIAAYSYAFTVTVQETGVQFSADILLSVEVVQ